MKKFFLIALLCIAVAAAYARNTSKQSDNASQTFSVQPGGTLEVNIDPGAIVVESWPDARVSVEADGINEDHPDWLSITQSGNTVTVRYRDKRRHTDHVQFIIHVPSSFNLDLNTTGGSILQKGSLTGSCTAASQGGSIEIHHVIGQVHAKTGGGSLTLHHVEGDAAIETGGGSIEAGTVTGSLKAHTGGGSMTFDRTGGTISASTGGGSVSVEHADKFLEVTTGGGGISLEDIHAGASVKTGGGGIEMEAIAGPITAKTGGGGISCSLTATGSGRSSLTTGGGDIQLSIPRRLSCTIEATIHLDRYDRRERRHSIRSDFKEEHEEGDEDGSDIHATYRINGGGERIELTTADSDIEILAEDK